MGAAARAGREAYARACLVDASDHHYASRGLHREKKHEAPPALGPLDCDFLCDFLVFFSRWRLPLQLVNWGSNISIGLVMVLKKKRKKNFEKKNFLRRRHGNCVSQP